MSTATKIMLLLAVLVVAVLATAAQLISVRERKINQAEHNNNTGELLNGTLVGQTFRAEGNNLSGIAVVFATYGGRSLEGPIVLHVRESLAATTDIRTASVASNELGDNQLHRFTFAPIPDSRGKSLFFYLEAPHAVVGHAATVDIDTRDPYHLGTAFIMRAPATTSDQALAAIAASGKPTVDLAFATYHSVPWREALLHQGRQAYHNLIVSFEQRRGDYLVWLEIVIPALLFFALLVFLVRHERHHGAIARRPTRLLLLGLFVLAVTWRLLYAVRLPVTSDEGSYLFDALSLRHGQLAGGDGYVKAPLVIAWIALWQTIFGNTILAGRLSSIVIGSLTMLPIFSLAKQLKNNYTGLLAAGAWALCGGAAVFNIYAHTQPLSLFFGLVGLATLGLAVRGATPRLTFFTPTARLASGTGWFVAAGLLLGLGVASRKSILAFGLVVLALILIFGHSWRARSRQVVAVGAGFILVIALLLAFAAATYGELGVWEALGLSSAEDGVGSNNPDEAEQIRAYSLRGMTPFFRESLPLILLSLIGWGASGEMLLRTLWQGALRTKPEKFWLVLFDHVLPKLAWLPPLPVFAWAFSFFFEYEGSLYMILGMPALWWFMAGVLALAALWPRPESEKFSFAEDNPAALVSTQPGVVPPALPAAARPPSPQQSSLHLRSTVAATVLLPVWLAGLVFFYVNWIKFHANYIGEFLPPLVIFAGLGAHVLWSRLASSDAFTKRHPLLTIGRRVAVTLVAITIIWAIIVTNYITFLYPHTGTFEQGSITEAAAWASEHIPAHEEIFTGAVLVPYLSGHPVTLNISHPRWYAYEFTRTDPERLNTFLPSSDAMVQAFRGARWFLFEKHTGFSFLQEYSELEASLSRDWQLVHEVENGDNPLRFYQRVTSNP